MIAPDIEPEAIAQLLAHLTPDRETGQSREISIGYHDGKFTVATGCTSIGGKVSSSKSLSAALRAAQGLPENRRICKRCQIEKPLEDGFGRLPGPAHSGGNSGYNRYCRSCEHLRQKDYEKRRKVGLVVPRPTVDKQLGRPHGRNSLHA
jgi:hypothetical protein